MCEKTWVDVTNVATSLCYSGNLFFSVFLLSTYSLLLLYRMLEHVFAPFYVATDAATSCLI